MFSPAKSLTLYKDFGKDVKDMLTKSYSGAQRWKVESKFKGPKDTVFMNPTVTSEGQFTTDVEFLPSQCDATLKLTVEPVLCNVKVTAGYRHGDHKMEAVVNRRGEYEVSHEMLMRHHVSSHAKLVKNAVELGVGASVARHCQVGCGARYQFEKGQGCDWSVSCRYAEAGRVLTVRTDKLKSYTTNFMTPVPTCPHNILVGGEVVCGRGKDCDWTAGIEAECLVFKGNKIKARLNKRKEWAVAYIAKLADNWTAAVTVDKNLKPGVLLTHS